MSRGLVRTREQAHRVILAGLVKVEGICIDKRARLVDETATIDLNQQGPTYVSRAGDKLAAALDTFGVNCHGLVAMDVGASTGGFTDCVLRHGAKKVYAIDVGYGQLDWTLRNDSRVIVRERCNIRYLSPDDIPDLIELAVIDVSFISLETVLPCVMKFLSETAVLVVLLKPQFEVGKGQVGRGGVVRDEAKRMAVKDRILTHAESLGLELTGVMDSPIVGRKGNKEILVVLKKVCEVKEE